MDIYCQFYIYLQYVYVRHQMEENVLFLYK